jgi:hypothetical protein
MKHRDIQVISPKALPGGFLMVTAEWENITEEMGKGSRFKINQDYFYYMLLGGLDSFRSWSRFLLLGVSTHMFKQLF